MSEPAVGSGSNEQTNEELTESGAVAGSAGGVRETQQPAGAEQESQSAPAAPAPSTTARDPASSDPATDTGHEVSPGPAWAGDAAPPPPAEGPGAGDHAAPERQGSEQQDPPPPQPVKAVPSGGSVFRQRDVREYDPFTAHLERRVTKLFEALDTEQTGRVAVHELGTLVRSVGCCPSESELQELVTQLEEGGQPGFVRLATVLPHIVQCVEDRKYPSATAEQLLQAFQVLADDCAAQEEARAGPKRERREAERDSLPQDKLVHILTEEGEHFSQEEVEEMLSVVPASDNARVRYQEFVKQLVVPELW